MTHSTSPSSIPAEAVEAARKVAFERYGSRPDTAYLRTILEAAAPHMLAEAWEQGWIAREDLHAYDVWGGEGEEPDSSNPYKKESK